MRQSVRRHEPGAMLSALLAITIHVALFTVLVVGVRWKTKQPDPVMAELWARLPPVEVPRVEPPRPEPKPAPKPAPKVEPKGPSKADIALEQERKRKEALERKRRDEEKRAKAEQEQKKREEEERRLEAEDTRRRMDEQLNRELAAAAPKTGPLVLGDPKAQARWIDRIRAKIKPNIVRLDLPGNPEAIFDVELLPTGEVRSVKLRKPSGVKVWDEAVERAILKSSPLPLPDQQEVFQRSLRLTFRPKD